MATHSTRCRRRAVSLRPSKWVNPSSDSHTRNRCSTAARRNPTRTRASAVHSVGALDTRNFSSPVWSLHAHTNQYVPADHPSAPEAYTRARLTRHTWSSAVARDNRRICHS
ncbi:hypothetical protein GobsT_34540 [Gemmata obscuriglobus]|nr:hypothetical protein GobsT_34540 [Gemmata obscuriglobus]VTS06900.1 unnamed protein product [Gemmata obscuriglobus UQM 2246]